MTRTVQPSSPSFRDGWVAFILNIIGLTYLIFVAALATIAIMPTLFGMQGSVVFSGSMEPRISPGDVVLTSQIPEDDTKLLVRVVSFVEDDHPDKPGTDQLILHRVVAQNENGSFVTAGDANTDVDSTPVARDQITGQGRLLVPFVGLPWFWLQTGNVVLFGLWAVLTGAALVAAVYLSPRKHDDESSDADSDQSPEPSHEPSVSRHGMLAVGAGLLFSAMLATPRDRAVASFSARTQNVRNTWSVAQAPALNPGRASTYAVFAATRISNEASPGNWTSIIGSVATSPGVTVQGFRPADISGSIDRNNAAARNARTDVLTLRTTLRSQPVTRVLSSNLRGTVTPGVFRSSGTGFQLPQSVTLDAQGDPSAVFVFLAEGAISLGTNSSVTLTNGASAANVFWVAASIHLGMRSNTAGTFLSDGNATVERDASLAGRIFSVDGSVDLTSATLILR